MSPADMKCVPCRGETLPMELERARQMLRQLSSGWGLNQAGHLVRASLVQNVALALELANAAGAVAEAEGHPPDL